MACELESLSAEALRAELEREAAEQSRLRAEHTAVEEREREAEERQRLRRELEESRIRTGRWRNKCKEGQDRRELIDQDRYGPHQFGVYSGSESHAQPAKRNHESGMGVSSTKYAESVVKREYTWTLSGLSWLPQLLQQEGRTCARSEEFEVDVDCHESKYILVFNPFGGHLEHRHTGDGDEGFESFDHDERGTLVLIRKESMYGTALDIRFSVGAENGDFRQWGDATRVSVPARDFPTPKCFLSGPDLATDVKGVFGLSFEALLESEWVGGTDAITFKVAIEEIAMHDHPTEGGSVCVAEIEHGSTPKPAVGVPPPTLASDFLAMLTEGRHSDVTVEALGEEAEPVRFSAHTNVLSQRSAVFAAAFAHGMRESALRTLTVTDVPPLTLKALLHFLYTDDFAQVLTVLHEGGVAGAAAPQAIAQLQLQLQAVLAAAHKYQVPRLLRWCEAQLCKHLSSEAVCSLLSLASLYEATELECSCLDFMKAHMADVVAQPDFAALSSACMLKFNMHVAGVGAHKRKREM